MSELITTHENEHGEILVSGRDLHDFLESPERYSRWFNRMIQYGFEENIDFTSVQKSTVVNNGAIREFNDHQLTIDMAKEISMLQRSNKGKQARQYFLKLEKLWNSPEAVMKRALEYADKQMVELKQHIQLNEPYTNFGKAVSNSNASINVGAFAKMMYDNHGIKLGRNKMFAWLRSNGYLIKHGRERNNPKQKYIEQGLFDTSVTLVSRTQGDVESVTTLITGKGQVKLAEKLKQEFAVTI